MKYVSIFVFALFCANVLGVSFSMAEEPNPFIRDGSIGIVPDESKPCPKSGFTFRPVKCWPGEKFIFLPSSKALQKFGYQSFKGGRGDFDQPTYEEAVGRIGTVLDVTKRFIGSMRAGWRVTIRMDDNGQDYTGEVFSVSNEPDDASVSGIAPILDLQAARNKWLGKTLWLKQGKVGTYDEATDKVKTLLVPNASRVTVIDVVAGWYNFTPIRFIVRTDSGVEGFKDFTLSGTNVSKLLRNASWNKFGGSFFERDPREIFDWSEHVWEAIASRSVFVGMQEGQARLSWGEPKDVHRTVLAGKTSEQWVYTEGYLYFENGILTSIQKR